MASFEKIKKDPQPREEIQPILVYEDVMYGQKVIVKRYPSNIPIIDIMPYVDDVLTASLEPK